MKLAFILPHWFNNDFDYIVYYKMNIFYILNTLFVLAADSDLSKLRIISRHLDSLFSLSEASQLVSINQRLSTLDEEFTKLESSISSVEQTLASLESSHSNFDEKKAKRIKSLVSEIEKFVDQLELKVRNIDLSVIKYNLPYAITGLSTADNQAKHSVLKIKQESNKLDSTISTNSKFLWVSAIIALITLMSIGTYVSLKKASLANI